MRRALGQRRRRQPATSRWSPSRGARGTSVILHLRDDAQEYLQTWKVKNIVNKYSDHISLPIQMEKEEWKDGELINPTTKNGGASRRHGQDRRMGNREQGQRPCGPAPRKTSPTRSTTSSTSSHQPRPRAALADLGHNRVEGSTEYTQLLYIPSKAPFDLWNRDKKGGLKLYVKRVFIMDDAEALLPATCAS